MKLDHLNAGIESSTEPSFGLRIENSLVQLAIATPDEQGRYLLSFDQEESLLPGGWLSPHGIDELGATLEDLVEKHQMRRQKLAVSLGGDFCVTRVMMGTAEQVDEDLRMLAERVPRYLQLGPGEKVTGHCRQNIGDGTDYAVTGVVNHSLIEVLYDVLRTLDTEIMWVEPSLISLARLTGEDERFAAKPVMIAEGMGNHWDVGIACDGRLLLDYRPAAATTVEGLCDAIVGHAVRLKRFCNRHRRIVSGELGELLMCASPRDIAEATERLQATSGLRAREMAVPTMPELFQVDSMEETSLRVPVIAAVYPLLVGTPRVEVPDLLERIRRAPDLSFTQRILWDGWPALVASVVLAVCYTLVSAQRDRSAGAGEGREALQSQIVATNAKFVELAEQRELLNQLKRIEGSVQETDWHQMLGWLTQTLPPSVRLDTLQVQQGGVLVMDGVTLDETVIYDLVNSFRHLPGVSQVALKGTTPNDKEQETQFSVQLTTRHQAEEKRVGGKANGGSQDGGTDA